MEQAKLYNILINPNGDVCIVLKPLIPYVGEIENPEILYDGGENAVLYRNSRNAIILDYIPEEQRKIIFGHKQILIVEYNIKSDVIEKEYFAFVTKVKKMLNLGQDFTTREELNNQLKELGLL